jgi:uncharacterized protein
MSQEISHDETQKRFFCIIDGQECVVDYEFKQSDPKTMDIYRTFVPPDLRGKGIAEKLLAAVTEYALAKEFVVYPSCSYAVLYYQRHKKHAVVLAKGVSLENGGSCRLK